MNIYDFFDQKSQKKRKNPIFLPELSKKSKKMFPEAIPDDF